jgi:transposase
VEKHRFIELVLKPPREVGRAFEAWSYRELQRTAIQKRIVGTIAIGTIHNWLKQAALKPWQWRYWLNSTDPLFEEKMFGIIRLYLEPPPGSVVLCVDEKTGMQALERVAPDKPMLPGKALRREFGYIRHGTRALFAAFNPHTGKVMGKIFKKHRGKEFCKFLKLILKKHPKVEIHLIVDNFRTHMTEEVRILVAKACGLNWKKMTQDERKQILQKPNKRVVFHFLPFHASWLNQVEIWFSFLSRDVLKRGSFPSLQDLIQKVLHYIRDYNRHRAHPFKWTYTGQPLAVGNLTRTC